MIDIGDIIDNRYNVLSHLGTGGMAVVFECKDLFRDRIVALKILKEELLDDKKVVSDFTKEVKASVCMSHQNIVQVFEDGVYQNRPYLVMEYLRDQTLLDKLEYFTKFTVVEACEIMCQLLDAVSCTHNHKILHRDIKPQNIFYLPNGTIKLTDFGISTSEKDAINDGKIIGSVHFMAPEVLLGKPFTVQSDIYSAGVTFFNLITGRLPFDGTTSQIAESHVKKSFPKPTLFNPQIPKEIESIIIKATQKNPKIRFKSAADFKKAIEFYVSGSKEHKSLLKRIFK